ncbi:MAG: hypothetical protein AB7G37_06315 [Solirubrobacteraceae bacterium]
MDEDASEAGSIAQWVRRQWERGDGVLAAARRDYWLNRAFYEGEQWVVWTRGSNELVEWNYSGKDAGRVKLTENRVAPNLVTNLARLLKSNLSFEVLADAADDGSLGGARIGEHALEATRHDLGWEDIRAEALMNAYLGGTSAVMWEWDPDAGEEFGVDPSTGKVIHNGEVALKALAITEFTLEPGSRNWRDAGWFITATTMPPAQVQEHFDLPVRPRPDATNAMGPHQRRVADSRSEQVELCTVYTFYQRPGRGTKGRHVVVVNDEAIIDRPWPFPATHKHLNIAVARQQQIPKRWHGHTILNDVRPLQVALNHAISNMTEHMKLAGNARLAVPDNSGVDAETLTDLPEVFTYDGMSSTPPRWVEPPNLARWIPDYPERCRAAIDDLMSVHDISRGQAPGDRNSGLALGVLAEKDETPMGLIAHDQAEVWSTVGSSVLMLWENNVVEHRTATVSTPSGLPQKLEWTGRHLHGQTRARVPLDSVMPRSRVAMQAWIMSMAERFPQMMPQNPAAMARLLDLPMQSEFAQLIDADVAEAEAENHLMSTGQIPSHGETPLPVMWQDHAKHIAEHNRFRKSRGYAYASADVRHIVDLHIQAHSMLAAEQHFNQLMAEQRSPGSSLIPQADEPPGSQVPPDFAERQQEVQLQTAGATSLPPANQDGGPNAGEAALVDAGMT